MNENSTKGDLLVVARSESTPSIYSIWGQSPNERKIIASQGGLNHGIAVFGGYLFASSEDKVYRYGKPSPSSSLFSSPLSLFLSSFPLLSPSLYLHLHLSNLVLSTLLLMIVSMIFFSSSQWTVAMKNHARRQKHSNPQTLTLQMGVLPGAEDFSRFSIGGLALNKIHPSPLLSL